MAAADTLTIRTITEGDIFLVQAFLHSQLQEFFCRDGKAVNLADVRELAKTYIEPRRSNLWGIFTREGNLAGTGAVCEYNNRIQLLKGRYHLPTTAEFGRCYVDKSLRRQGMGSRLVQLMAEFAKEAGYDRVYLHTHRFLPGGFSFWSKQGFTILLEEGGQDEIVHMEKNL